MHTSVSLQTLDYIVVAFILFVSLGISVVFAVKDFRNVNRVEYLLGGRCMSMLPVALSILATFTSGITLLGGVTDIYMYGLMSAMVFAGMGLGFIYAMFSIVPLMYPLRLTSLYQYLQLRFDSSAVRLLAVVIGMLQTLCYMAITLLSPALTLQASGGMPMWMSVGAVGFIGTVYTAVGGIKSVIWTDAFQTIVMIGGAITIIIKGNSIVGGGTAAWKIAQAGGRTVCDNFDPDPRVRNTWWGTIIGLSFYWLALICNQSSLQRISAMKSLKDAKNAFLLSAVLLVFLGGLLAGLALVIYAYFSHIRCDPFQADIVSNPNQIPPYFVMHALRDVPGIVGIYMAIIFSGSLSTLSSGINALAAITVEDLLKKPLHNLQESTITVITKLLVFLYGILAIGLAYAARTLQGPMFQIGVTSLGAWGGPILGVFLLSALFPWTNKYGAFGGGVIAIFVIMWIALGNQIFGRRSKPLSFPPTDMCFLNNSLNVFINASFSKQHVENKMVSLFNQSEILNNTRKGDPYRFSLFFYDIAFQWYAFIGTMVCLVVGMTISYFSHGHCTCRTDERYLFPFVRKFWIKSQYIKSENNGEIVQGLIVLPQPDNKRGIVSHTADNKGDNQQLKEESNI